MTHVMALQPGTELAGEYRLERVLGAGGFGITYLAEEIPLQRAVTVKEYFPSDYAARSGADAADAVPRSKECAADYEWGLDRFIDEAKTLARFDHRNIVRVFRYFQANNTAYMVLKFEEGQSLKTWLKSLNRAPRQSEIDRILAPLLDALELVHNADILHRDIAPDNIIIRTDGSPVLIDFGAARAEIARHSRTVSALVKPGYSPYEQYSDSGRQQGPWTDIYALSATLYHAVTGKRPPDAPSRVVKDELVPARDAALAAYRVSFLAAIDRGMNLDVEKRPRSIAAWRGDLLAPEPIRRGWWKGAEPPGGPDAAGRARTEALDKTRPLPDQAMPPPDMDGPQGRLLDYIEGLKGKPKGGTSEPPHEGPVEAAPAAASASAAADAPTERMARRTAALPVPVARKPAAVAATPRRLRPSRPRALPGSFARWRPTIFKLLIGAGIAAAAVSLQDRLPRVAVPAPKPGSPAAPLAPESLLKRQFVAHQGAATFVGYAHGGRWLVTAGADGTLKTWSTSWDSLLRTLDVGRPAPTAVAVQGQLAATGHADGRVVLHDLDRSESVARMKRNDAAIWSIAFLPGSEGRLAAAGHDWAVAIWNRSRPDTPFQVFEGHENAVQSLAISPGGALLASGSADRTVRLWNMSVLSLQRSYRGHRDFVVATTFSPDGRLLASAGHDGTVRVWSSGSSRLVRILRGHRGKVLALDYSPDGGLLATGGEDGTVRVWSASRGRQLRVLGSSSAAVRAVAFAPDGKVLASASDDGTVRIWNVVLPRPGRGDD